MIDKLQAENAELTAALNIVESNSRFYFKDFAKKILRS